MAAEIKERFRFLSHAYHPDKFATEAQRRTAEHDFKRINEAYQVLSDSAQRSRYDATRSRTDSAPPSSPPRQKRAPHRIGLAALVIGIIAVVIWLWPFSTATPATPFLSTAVPGKQLQLSSLDWTAIQNEESHAKNFESRHKTKDEVFSQVVTVFLIEMSPDRRIGTRISDSEHVEFFSVLPDSVIVQVRREKQGYWILSRQTFALSGASLEYNYSDADITRLRHRFQNEIDRTRLLLSETF
jgi:hypothetical protein